MNAPLSRYLTSFAADAVPAVIAVEAEIAPVEVPILPPMESDLEIAVREARLEAETRRDAEIAALVEAHSTTMAAALDAARTDWAREEGQALASRLDTALDDLKQALANRLAAVLRPLLADALVTKTVEVLGETIDRILADADHPCLSIRGPADLLAAIRARRASDDGMTYETSDDADVLVTADGLRIETRLGQSLIALSGTES